MVRSGEAAPGSGGDPLLTSLHRGAVLGLLAKQDAERAFRIYDSRRIDRIVWTGPAIEGTMIEPACTVTVEGGPGRTLRSRCTRCGERPGICVHAAAVLFRWLDIRPTMLRKGPNTVWRSRARQPFLALGGETDDRLDLTHATGPDLRAALELQLSLHRARRTTARLVDGHVEIGIDLPSGHRRTVLFPADNLPHALPILRSLEGLDLEGDLAHLELSEIRLRPTLEASLENLRIRLEPGYRLPDGRFIPLAEVEKVSFGRWARVGRLLCRRLDPDTPLLPFFRRGRQVLEGRDALNFLLLDHPTLVTRPWYAPRGALARLGRAITPALARIVVHDTKNGRILVEPVFSAGGQELTWQETLELIAEGFTRKGDLLLRAPELSALERAGFKPAGRRRSRGLSGDRVALLRLLAETDVPVTGDSRIATRLAEVLRGDAAVPEADPPGLRSVLRPYQRAGVAWLWLRHDVGVGALLADDMGLGKTHQVMGLLCLMCDAKPAARALIVCPRGVLEHWQDLLERYAPGIPMHTFHGPERSLEEVRPGTAAVLTTYETMVRSTDELAATAWDLVVFDEAQRMKNPRTKASRAARKIPAGHRVALTGTPLENRLTELWSIIDLIVPGYLGSERAFRSTYRDPGRKQLDRLRRRIGMLTLRRLKSQVLADLPDKLEDIRHCSLLPAQETLYREIQHRQAEPLARQLLDTDAKIPYVHIFALLTRLKQVCDHPGLVDDAAADVPSGKLTVLDELLDEALGGDQQVVVFTQYVKMIHLLSLHLKRRRIPHLALSGESHNRGRIIRRFNSGQHEPVLLASLLAGGVGVDLTGASVVIHYDRWWNPAKENQATDRVHRIGQQHFVQVYKLITRNTIEERIDRIIRSKTALLETVVTPTENVIASLSRAEIAELLGLDQAAKKKR